ncbi:hypothetical protein EV401DRAFT_1855424 [Pisolithus croceorrhizus]|nr:hypothetical protein EV401DRAFT_1855424 [Pisolithus croceorrhizus]
MTNSLLGPTVLEPSPSLPPSPTSEDGLNRSREWRTSHEDHFELEQQHSSSSCVVKGKEKQLFHQADEEQGEREEGNDDTIETVYPPSGDATAETRRVEETLKRWEVAERQRRKAARESVQMTTGPSVLGDVTRKASLILSRRHPPQRASGLGDHRALKSRDSIDVVPLSDMDHSPQRVVHSPTPFIGDSDNVSTTTNLANPFIHPSERRLSSSPLVAAVANSISRLPANVSPTNSPPSVPVPPPHVPPSTPNQKPPSPIPPLAIGPSLHEPEPQKQVRWWHEWLCGCGEGPDRGGDNQAARTNPFE